MQHSPEDLSNDDPLYPPEMASGYLHTPPATLSWWRHIGRGPNYVKLGKRVFYRRSALDAFLNASEVVPEAEATPQPTGRRRGRTRKVPAAADGSVERAGPFRADLPIWPTS